MNNFKEKRFLSEDKNINNMGPGFYYDNQDYWNKRTYNLLFSEF
jgi:hypothetical protein